MARAMASQATRMKSSASCSGAGGSTPAARMLAATAASACARRLLVERPGAVRPEHAREERRPQLAGHQVAVGHRERPALAVAGRAGVGAGAARPDAVAAVLEGADRAAAGGDRVHAQHRRAQAHAADHALVAALVARRRSGSRRWTCRPCRRRSTLSNPARRLTATAPTMPPAGPERMASLPRKSARVGEAAVRLHEAQRARRPAAPRRRPRSGAGWGRGRRRRRWSRRGRRASSAGSSRARRRPGRSRRRAPAPPRAARAPGSA